MAALRALADQPAISSSTALQRTRLRNCVKVAGGAAWRPQARQAGRKLDSELASAGSEAAATTLLKNKAMTVLLCANDTLALSAMADCRHAGRAVGQPGGVVVID